VSKNYLSIGSLSIKPFPYQIVTSFGCLAIDLIVHMELVGIMSVCGIINGGYQSNCSDWLGYGLLQVVGEKSW
jgi:hypothetical protein